VLLLSVSPGLVSGSLGTEIAYFVNCIAKEVPPDYVTLQEALDGLRVAWAIIQSCKEGGSVEL
jgi:predicted dehydrogenase